MFCAYIEYSKITSLFKVDDGVKVNSESYSKFSEKLVFEWNGL